jgi:hypothetical protein
MFDAFCMGPIGNYANSSLRNPGGRESQCFISCSAGIRATSATPGMMIDDGIPSDMGQINRSRLQISSIAAHGSVMMIADEPLIASPYARATSGGVETRAARQIRPGCLRPAAGQSRCERLARQPVVMGIPRLHADAIGARASPLFIPPARSALRALLRPERWGARPSAAADDPRPPPVTACRDVAQPIGDIFILRRDVKNSHAQLVATCDRVDDRR